MSYTILRYTSKPLARGRERANNLFFNLLAFLLILCAFTIIGWGAHQANKPLSSLEISPITLDYYNLFAYTLRTFLRMFLALCFAIIFSLIYAKLAVLNTYFEQILIPILDVLQSVPILGFISFTITIFLGLFPGEAIGAECACIFAIFTSQAWNMTYSFYQSLKNIPQDLHEVAIVTKMSSWQKFWRLEMPYGIPSLVLNIFVSVSNGWFFVVASEVVLVGNTQIILPGVGSYISLALEQGDMQAIYWAIIAIVSIIFIYDRILLRPLLIWSERFQYSASNDSAKNSSFIFNLFQKKLWINYIFYPLNYLTRALLYAPFFNHVMSGNKKNHHTIRANKLVDYMWYGSMIIVMIIGIFYLMNFLAGQISFFDIIHTFSLTGITLIRICVMMLIASIIWLPIGVYIALRPALVQNIQPLIQFLAAFPVNLLFPLWASYITSYNLEPNIWLSPLIIIGAQWYILFNVIAGTLAFPKDLTELAFNIKMKGVLWWRKCILPGILPYFLTGLITAFGGAWNASIVAEVINFHGSHLTAYGIGSYIAEQTARGDYPRIILGIIMMSLFVLIINRMIWAPLYNIANNKYRII